METTALADVVKLATLLFSFIDRYFQCGNYPESAQGQLKKVVAGDKFS